MFKLNILNRFLLRRFFSGFGLVMLVVCGTIMAVTFVERLPSNPTVLAALSETWIRLMEYVPLFLPLAVFMGTLLASYNLTKSSEKVIIASAGLSPYQMARPFLIGATLIGIIATTLINPYSVGLNQKNITSNHLVLIDNEIWLREASENGYITMNAKGMHKSETQAWMQKMLPHGTKTVYLKTLTGTQIHYLPQKPFWTGTYNQIRYLFGNCPVS